MAPTTPLTASLLHDALTHERPRLVGLCAYLARNADAAEDLAQETLYEAWKHRSDLRHGDRCAEWLSGIARNVCRRWRHRELQEAVHRSNLPITPNGAEDASLAAGDSLDQLADDVELDAELERRELAALLDHALALLVPETRIILCERYIEHAAHAEIARRLGISEGAVKVRLHRGRLALRRVLLSEFAASVRSYGLAPSSCDGWDDTRLWCTLCGRYKLLGRLNRRDGLEGRGEFSLRCPGCFAARGLVFHHSDASLLGSVTCYKPAMGRIATWADRYFRDALRRGMVLCRRCGHTAVLTIEQGDTAIAATDPVATLRTLVVTCGHCGQQNTQSHAGLILFSAQGQAFWRAHPRIHLLPEREVETQGQLALVTSFESVTDGARLDVISARETYQVLDSQCTGTAPHVG